MQKVIIAGIPFDVVECHENFGDVFCGKIKYRNQTIRINEDMAPEYKEQTLIHEMVHGILVGIGRNDLSDDEVFVQSLATGIYTSSFQIKEEK